MIEVWRNVIQDTDLQRLNNAVLCGSIMEGYILKEFEERIKNILKVDYVIGVSSGSAALALAFMGIGIQPGDEVIVPDLTFIATANAAHLLGAVVIVAPVKDNSPLLDETAIDNYITSKTKAIVTVDLNGRIACSRELKEKYASRGIHVVEDACQAFMSRGQDGVLAGVHADVACYSFGITKMITTVMGGLVATNNEEVFQKIKLMKTQGMSSVFEGDKYIYPGFNFKLPDVLAAIGIGQLESLEQKIERMREIDQLYRAELTGIEGISFLEREEGEHPWMTDIICENKNCIRKILSDNGIISRPLGKPLHTADFLISKGDYRASDEMRRRMLYLPSGPNQDIRNIEKVIHVLKSNILK